jgi:hypothetical protein
MSVQAEDVVVIEVTLQLGKGLGELGEAVAPGGMPVAIPEAGAVVVPGENEVVGGVVPLIALGGVDGGGAVLDSIEAEGLGLFAEGVPVLPDAVHQVVADTGAGAVALSPEKGADGSVMARHVSGCGGRRGGRGCGG